MVLRLTRDGAWAFVDREIVDTDVAEEAFADDTLEDQLVCLTNAGFDVAEQLNASE